MSKVWLYILFFVLTSFNLSAQIILNDQKDVVYTIVEEQAEFPGGINQMYKFISMSLKYPAIAREYSIGGKVFLKFVVHEDGTIHDINVIKSCGFNMLDSAAIDVVGDMPVWKPAKMTGVPVKCFFNLPINFKIDSPFFVFAAYNTNENIAKAKAAVLNKNLKEAKKILKSDQEQLASLYNLGVVHFQLKEKKEAKICFEKIRTLGENKESTYYQLSCNHLNKYF